MRTQLTPEAIASLHAQGQAQTGPFVNPHTIYRVKQILRDRGEDWAASILLRDLSRRSLINASFPWLESGDEETLALADAAEWALLEESLR